MSYIKIRFHNDRSFIEREIQEALDGMLRISGSPVFSIGESTWRPHADLYETQEEIILRVDLAGVQRENIHLEVSRTAIRIHGVREQQVIPGTTRYRLAEIPYGYFERHLALTAVVDPDRIDATYNNGVLEVRMVKKPPESDIRRKIEVNKS